MARKLKSKALSTKPTLGQPQLQIHPKDTGTDFPLDPALNTAWRPDSNASGVSSTALQSSSLVNCSIIGTVVGVADRAKVLHVSDPSLTFRKDHIHRTKRVMRAILTSMMEADPSTYHLLYTSSEVPLEANKPDPRKRLGILVAEANLKKAKGCGLKSTSNTPSMSSIMMSLNTKLTGQISLFGCGKRGSLNARLDRQATISRSLIMT
jgi:hypothetical protein